MNNYEKFTDSAWRHESLPLEVSVQQPKRECVREAHPYEVMIVYTDTDRSGDSAKHLRSSNPVNLLKHIDADSEEDALEKAENWMNQNQDPKVEDKMVLA